MLPAALSTGDFVTDLPRLSQWMNCLTDIVMSPVGYDSREAILVTVEGQVGGDGDGGDGGGPVVSLVGKGFSRISAMCFAIIYGAEAVEAFQASDQEVDEKHQEDLDLWKMRLGVDSLPCINHVLVCQVNQRPNELFSADSSLIANFPASFPQYELCKENFSGEFCRKLEHKSSLIANFPARFPAV